MKWRALSISPCPAGKAGVNWTLFAQVIAGWIMTLVIAALGAAMFTAQGLYAPHISHYGKEEGYAVGTDG